MSLSVGLTVYIRNRGYQEGKVLEIRKDEDGNGMVAVKFEDPRLPTDWVSAQECLLENPNMPRRVEPSEPPAP